MLSRCRAGIGHGRLLEIITPSCKVQKMSHRKWNSKRRTDWFCTFFLFTVWWWMATAKTVWWFVSFSINIKSLYQISSFPCTGTGVLICSFLPNPSSEEWSTASFTRPVFCNSLKSSFVPLYPSHLRCTEEQMFSSGGNYSGTVNTAGCSWSWRTPCETGFSWGTLQLVSGPCRTWT